MGIFKNSPSPLAVFFMSPKMNNEKTHPPESRPHPSNSSISFPTGFETHGRKRGKKRKKKKTKGYLGCSLPRAILVFFFFEFQLMLSVPNNNSLLSNQNTNQF